MKITERILCSICSCYRSEWDQGHPLIKAKAGTADHDIEYGFLQLSRKITYGLGVDVYGKTVLEIGCGHGGICVYAALNGAKSVIGIDVSEEALTSAGSFVRRIERDVERTLNIRLALMRAEQMDLEGGAIDVIIADNVFEHVSDLESTLAECKRVMKPGGRLVVPNFPSYYSKFGPHVKYGIKIPWVHVLFGERTIVNVMHRMAQNDPQMFVFYPGLRDGAQTFRDIRRCKDLGYITNRKFINAAHKVDLLVESLCVSRPLLAKVIFKIMPALKNTRLDDILSYGTSACLYIDMTP